VAQPVPIERRLGFDRRSLRERRAPSTWKGNAQLAWAPNTLSPPPASTEAPPFARRLWEMARLELTEHEAERHWGAITQHRQNLSGRIGRDIDQEVATLDYLLNVKLLAKPTVIESATLAQIERNAMMDGLTGLFNRRFFESSLGREAERSRRHRLTSSLLMLDLDGFKTLNDRFGHGMGDRVLQMLGELILRRLRAIDLPCRYGGDEFAVVLPDTDRTNACLTAERLRASVGRHFHQQPVRGSYLQFTVSVGVATYSEACATVDALVQAADHALYLAKGAGGNRVFAAP
jgi:diguanylate cyclase (GGDEF)-like protein